VVDLSLRQFRDRRLGKPVLGLKLIDHADVVIEILVDRGGLLELHCFLESGGHRSELLPFQIDGFQLVPGLPQALR
jgi:hypothetical protein